MSGATIDYSIIGFLIALAAFFGSIGTAFILIRSGRTKNTLTLDSNTIAAAALQRDILKDDIAALQKQNENMSAEMARMKDQHASELADLRRQNGSQAKEIEYLREIISSRDIILNGFEAQGVSYDTLTATRPSGPESAKGSRPLHRND